MLGRLEAWLHQLLDTIDGSSTAQGGLAVLILLLLIVAAVLVLRRTGRLRRTRQLSAPVELDAERSLSGDELRERARRALAEGRHDDATVIALRALVRDLEERTLLDVTAGMTAHEAAVRAATAFPQLRSRLTLGANAFDTAAYSLRSTSAKQAEDLLLLAEYIAETAPDLEALDASADSAEQSLVGAGEPS
ncbi:DUF4129 domain-containing protein [Brachybacterium sp. Marseille-Q7125]|uniref:DUF4129 domain-containing protein n=1 Tax=Brachybacterium sp. Marseille-Q7125 TaxID=2932815 RepID=UPI001FF476D7|nr:DUF4129 domain-containing protein [Brachybacterium sp. Marseille-Q7125]